MAIGIIDDSAPSIGSIFGSGNDLGARLLKGGDGLIEVGDAETEAGARGGVFFLMPGIDFENRGAELGGIVLRAGAVGVFRENQAQKLVKARGAVDVRG